jgi:uncharacterized membrane protein YGL010W
MKLHLNREWSILLERYKGDHKDPRNRATHMVGIPIILASLPISATVVGLPLGAAMFTGGWALQFLGHYYEGNDPAFFTDRRSLAVGAMWWAEKVGLLSLESEKPEAPKPVREPLTATA